MPLSCLRCAACLGSRSFFWQHCAEADAEAAGVEAPAAEAADAEVADVEAADVEAAGVEARHRTGTGRQAAPPQLRWPRAKVAPGVLASRPSTQEASHSFDVARVLP